MSGVELIDGAWLLFLAAAKTRHTTRTVDCLPKLKFIPACLPKDYFPGARSAPVTVARHHGLPSACGKVGAMYLIRLTSATTTCIQPWLSS